MSEKLQDDKKLKKVRELVEWARLSPFVIKNMVREQFDEPIARGIIITLCKSVAEAQLKKAYSHPDLALIDRERNKERYLVHRMAVIPLADYFKEVFKNE
jgi:hypothetical protein